MQKRGGKGEKNKKGKVKGKKKERERGQSSFLLSPILSFFIPPSLPPQFSFEASYTDIKTVNLLLFFNLRNLREESFEDWEGVRQ